MSEAVTEIETGRMTPLAVVAECSSGNAGLSGINLDELDLRLRKFIRTRHGVSPAPVPDPR